MNPTWANGGFTVEFRAKVTSAVPDNQGAFAVLAQAVGASTTNHSFLNIGDDKTYWGEGGDAVALDNHDITDGFHVFRIAQAPGATTFHVWRDGILLSDSVGASFPFPAFINGTLSLGDFGSGQTGTAEIDWIRFTSGFFAPVPEPSTMVLLALGGLCLATVGRRRGARA